MKTKHRSPKLLVGNDRPVVAQETSPSTTFRWFYLREPNVRFQAPMYPVAWNDLLAVTPHNVGRSTTHTESDISSFLISANFAAIVGLPLISFLTDKSSALLLARRRLFSEPSSASLVF